MVIYDLNEAKTVRKIREKENEQQTSTDAAKLYANDYH
jgi:hypothetical protein